MEPQQHGEGSRRHGGAGHAASGGDSGGGGGGNDRSGESHGHGGSHDAQQGGVEGHRLNDRPRSGGGAASGGGNNAHAAGDTAASQAEQKAIKEDEEVVEKRRFLAKAAVGFVYAAWAIMVWRARPVYMCWIIFRAAVPQEAPEGSGYSFPHSLTYSCSSIRRLLATPRSPDPQIPRSPDPRSPGGGRQ